MSGPTEASSTDSPSTSTPKPVTHRVRVACKACNARRVKCDADQGQPCWQCRTRQIPCELLDSRRGRYVRRKPRKKTTSEETRRDEDMVVDQQSIDLQNSAEATPEGADEATSTPEVNPLRDSQQEDDVLGPFGPVTPELISTPRVQAEPVKSNVRTGHSADCSDVSYIVEVVHRPKDGSAEPLRVHYPIPASIVDHSAPSYGPGAVEEPMSLQEALAMPAPGVADHLVRAFFEIIHVAYPVFDRGSFMRQYDEGRASPLVLQTIFLLGFTVGSDSLVQDAGFSDRATARRTHYLRAKTLYNADYDNDRMNLVAVLLLLGFWWAGYDEQKDTCHWVGCATTLAQSLGMHRSTSQPAMSPQMRSLRKRIWWAVYTRDRHTSAAFGRPCRIRDEDCDVESLTEDDFTFDNEYDQRLIPVQQDFHVKYVLEMTKLATILGDVLIAEFSPRRPLIERFETNTLKTSLQQWESGLPEQLRMSPLDGGLGAPFWASMLHFHYRYCQILLFRPKSIEIASREEAERDSWARMAADAITRNAEDQLSADTIRCGQIHLVPALFGALSIHTIAICRNDYIKRRLAENKSRQCLLALSELSKSWPVRIWISKSFVNLMTRLTSQGSTASGGPGAIVNVSSSIVSPHSADGDQAAASDTTGMNGFVNTSSQFQHHQGCDDFAQANDKLFHDGFWTSYLDSVFDVDLLIHPSTETL